MAVSEQEEFEFRNRLEKESKGNVTPPKPLKLGNVAEVIPQEYAKIEPEKPSTLGEKVGGALDAASTMFNAVPASITGQLGATYEALKPENYGKNTPEAQKRIDEAGERGESLFSRQPKTKKGKEYVGDIANAIEKSGIASLPPVLGGELTGISRMGKASLPQVKGAGKVAAKAVGESPEAFAAKNLAGKVGKAVMPNLSPEDAELVRKAESLGIKVTPDMVSDNSLLQYFGKIFREVPLSGAITDKNRTAFNKAVLKTIGADSRESKINPTVFSKTMNEHGKTIGEISSRHPIQIRDNVKLQQESAEFMKNLAKETPDVEKVIVAYMDDIKSRIKDGKIDGETFRKIRTQVGNQMRSTTNGDLRRALNDLDEMMLDAVESQLSPKELKEFTEARHYYYNGKLIEPLVAKAATKGGGYISPAAYANAISSGKSRKAQIAMGRGGEPADIAAIGSRFVPEPGNSNPIDKALAYTGLALTYPAANFYNRVTPKLTRKLAKD